MFLRRRDFTFLALTLALAACGPNADAPTAGAPATQMVLNRGNGGEPKSLDPHYIQAGWEIFIENDILMGLTTNGPDALPLPGAAERWEVSEDGLTWTFHLRDHVWSDGTPVTSGDFVFAWQRILDPKTAAQYASMLYDIKNGAAIAAGKMPPSMLGVQTPDDKTLVVTLEHPAAYFDELMTHVATFPIPRHVVEAKGDDWVKAENFVGNGAYIPKEWVPNDHITLVKNPRFYDSSNVKIDVVNYFPTTDYDAAIRRIRAGELDLQNQFSAAQIDWLRTNMPDALRITPSLTTFFIAMNQERKPFDDVRVREALNLALDREAIVNDIRRMGEPVAYSLVPPQIANYAGGPMLSFKDMPRAARLERARALMREAGYTPERPLKTTYLASTSTDNRRLSPVIQSMLKEIAIDAEIVAVDPQIMYERLHEKDYNIGYSGWGADYDDAYNFLGILALSNSGMNYQGYSNARFDGLIAEAQRERDAAKRMALMQQAEKILLDDYVFAPYRYSVSPDLVQPYVKGWIANGKNVNSSRWLSVERP